MKKDKKDDAQIVVRKIDAGTWSLRDKAVPGFRLSKSTMSQATPSQRKGGSASR